MLEAQVGWPPALLLRARVLTEAGDGDALNACARLLRHDRFAPDAIKTTLRLVGLGKPNARSLLRLIPVEVLRNTLRDALQQAVYTQGQSYLDRLALIAREDLDEDPWNGAAMLYAASLCAGSDRADLSLQARNWYRSLKVRSG